MKLKGFSLLFGILFLCCTSFSLLQAQNDYQISGPQFVCSGDSVSYQIVTNAGSPGFLVEIWELDGGIIGSGSTSISLVLDAPGVYFLSALVVGPDGQTENPTLTITVLLGANNIELQSTALDACPANSAGGSSPPGGTQGDCEQVCAFSTVTYTVPGADTLDWDIQGAENFTINGNSATVEWGPPGSGTVKAGTFTSVGNGLPDVVCGISDVQSGVNGDEVQVFTYINNLGSGPYIIEYTDPTGNLISTDTVQEGVHEQIFPQFTGTILITVFDNNGNVVGNCDLSLQGISACGYDLIAADISEPCDSCNGIIDLDPFGFPPYTYLWSTGATTEDLTGLCPGIYSVSIVDGQGCATTRSYLLEGCPTTSCGGSDFICVEIIENPRANFTALPQPQNDTVEICEGQTVFFDNLTTGAVSYEWNFGDGKSSSQTEPEHTYEQEGLYQVDLIARNACLCSDSARLFVRVIDAVRPEIQCGGTLCENTTATYHTDIDCNTFQWIVSGNGTVVDGGGTTDNFVTIDWGGGPVGAITLEVADCNLPGNICMTPTVEQIGLISENAQIEGPDKVCQGERAAYRIFPYRGTSFTWSTSAFGFITQGQGSNEVTVQWAEGFLPSQEQWVAVEYENCYLGCGGRDTIFVNMEETFALNGPIEACEGEQSTYFTLSQSGMSVVCDWTVLDPAGAVLTTFNGQDDISLSWDQGAGRYTIIATPVNPDQFCNDDYRIFPIVRAAPDAPASINGPELICPGESYRYEALPQLPGSTFEWTVENGGSITVKQGAQLTVSWAAAGPRRLSVQRVSTTGLPCVSDTLSLEIDDINQLELNGPAEVCREEIATYATSAYPGADYQWTISPAGAGTVISGQGGAEVEVLWHEDGPATVSVSLCGLAADQPVFVNPLPEPALQGPLAVCAGDSTDLTTVTPYMDYAWIGENSQIVSTAPDPQLPPGYYQLQVTDANGCRGDTLFQVSENALPTALIDVPIYAGLCQGGEPAVLTALSTSSGFSYQWFQDGNPVGVDAPIYATDQLGSYFVEIVDANGCANASNVITLQDCEAVGGECVSGVCTPQGGGPPSPGCTPDGSLNFEIDATADCATRQFTNTSVNFIPGSLSWNFDDPLSGAANTSNLENPQHTYVGGIGFYAVELEGLVQAQGGGSCPRRIVRNDTVRVAADFSPPIGCAGAAIDFQDASSFLPFASITDYAWDFGDPGSGAANTATGPNPSHVFDTAGNYAVTLTITADDGCQTSVTRTVVVLPAPPTGILAQGPECAGTAYNFVAQVDSTALNLSWDFGDPAGGSANNSTLDSAFYLYPNPGSYTVSLTAGNIFGCTATDTQTVEVFPNSLTGQIDIFPNPTLCEGDTATLTASPGGAAWQWSNGESSESIQVSEEDVYSLTVTDANGCTYRPDVALLTVIKAPEDEIRAVQYTDDGLPAAYFYNGLSICEGDDLYLEMVGFGDHSYVWSTGQVDTAISFTEDRLNQLSAGTYDFTVTITDNQSGCTSVEGPFTVEVNPAPPQASLTSDPAPPLCEGTPAEISVAAPQPDLTYLWSTGAVDTMITSGAAGDYFAIAVNTFGCRTRSDTISIQPGPDIRKIPDGCLSRCNPDTLCLPELPDVVSYQWFLDGNPLPPPQGNQEEPIFDQSGEYVVEMENAAGCVLASEPFSIDLFPGFGDVLGLIYEDVNNNGAIDGPDTLIGGIPVIILLGGIPVDTTFSDSLGQYIFPLVSEGNYQVQIDTNSLPTELQGVITQWTAPIVGCDVENGGNGLVDIGCPPVFDTLALSACPGTVIDINGQALMAGDNANFLFTSADGCDSVLTVTVSALPTDTTFLTLNACAGDSVFTNGVWLNAGAVDTFFYLNQIGCDSLVIAEVQTLPSSSGAELLSACPGGTVQYQGQSLAAGSVTDVVLANQFGCDSVVTVTVEALPTDTTELSLGACAGDSVFTNNVWLTAGEIDTFFYLNQIGCDSVVIAEVETLPSNSGVELLNACPGGTVQYQGQSLAAGSVTDVVLVNRFGCDSVVTVTVEALPLDTTPLSLQVCPDSFVLLNGNQIFPGETADVMFTGSDGCDSVVRVSVGAYDVAPMTIDYSLPSCAGEATGEFAVNWQSIPPRLFSIDGMNTQESGLFENLPPGDYAVVGLDGNGCRASSSATIGEIAPLQVGQLTYTLDCFTPQVTLTPVNLSGGEGEVQFIWSDGSREPSLEVTQPGAYDLLVSNECEDLNLEVVVRPDYDTLDGGFFVPNVFSPNDDGFNDRFEVSWSPDVEVISFELHVYSRWGELLFLTENPSESWDGRMGNRLDPGVFVWQLWAEVADCRGQRQSVYLKGDVTIVR